MTFSKVVSGMGGAPSGLLKSGTNIASKSGKDWVSYGGPRAGLDPAITFYAPLNNSTLDILGAVATFTRASDGLYLPYSGADWRTAGSNVSRHESAKLLMEPAITNKNTNYNANPDAALTGLQGNGATASRSFNPDAIAAAGLSQVCTSGYVAQFENTSGSVKSPYVDGIVGNTNPHTMSVFVNTFGSDATLKISGGTGITINSTSLQRFDVTETPLSNARVLQFTIDDGEKIQFVLNQLEENAVVSSPIVTLGAAGQRAIDLLSWAGASGFFNQAQGMALITLKPGYSKTDQAAVLQGILSLDSASSSNLLFMDGSIKSTDGTNTAAVVAPAFSDGDELKLAVVYGPTGASALQVGYSLNGAAWVWSIAVAYDGGFTLVSALILARAITLPGRYASVYLYNENRGTAWVESNY